MYLAICLSTLVYPIDDEGEKNGKAFALIGSLPRGAGDVARLIEQLEEKGIA